MRPDLFFPPVAVQRKTLRPHQEAGLVKLDASLDAGNRRPLLMGATGVGKTLMAARIIEKALDYSEKVIFLAPAVDLIDQTIAAFRAEGITDIGAMQADHPLTDPYARVQVATIQTLARRKMPDGVGFVIVDEAQIIHKSLVDLMAAPEWKYVPFVGLSATPWSAGLGRIYDDLIIVATTQDLIDKKFLAPFVVYAPSTPDLSGVKTVAGEFQQDQLAEAVDRPQIVGDIIKTWLERGENRPTLAFGVNRSHAEHLQQRFREAGVAAEYLDCFSDREERKRVFDAFNAGVCKVICNVNLLTTGFDAPFVSCLIDAKPTKSEMQFVQRIGRGLRTAPGKTDCIVLDHAGNTRRLGFVTDIVYDTLDDGERKTAGERKEKDKTPLPRLCEECSAVVPHKLNCCPQCGAQIVAKSNVVASEGKLVLFGSAEAGDYVPTIAEKAQFFGELKGYCEEENPKRVMRGKAPLKASWASVQFKEKYGHWPNPDRISNAMPVSPSLKTRNWIRNRLVAYAKGRAAHG